MKGATVNTYFFDAAMKVSIHAPNEGSDREIVHICLGENVSIHAPNEGSDKNNDIVVVVDQSFQSTLPMKGATSSDETPFITSRFQSTLPMKGATNKFWCHGFIFDVSIHAPNEGSDRHIARLICLREFQSTLPMKGATRY